MIFGEDGRFDALAHVWMFIVAPLAGALLAALAYNLLFDKNAKTDEMEKVEKED